jgi:hypothetical protein
MKTLNILRIEGMYLNTIKAILDEFTRNIILNTANLRAFFMIRNKTKLPTLATSIKHRTRSPNQSY